jgi:hypothetical protein
MENYGLTNTHKKTIYKPIKNYNRTKYEFKKVYKAD